MKKLSILFCLSLVSFSLFAAVETFEFSSDEIRDRYQQLVEQLRCPKCQNQNLAGSDSPISADLRREIYLMLEEGQSDQQIIDFLVARYGTFVLYDPPKTGVTRWVWLLPPAFLLLGLALLVRVIRSASDRPVPEQPLEDEV